MSSSLNFFIIQARNAVVNDVETDGAPNKNLRGYTSLPRLLLLLLITLSLWYSVGVGVSQFALFMVKVFQSVWLEVFKDTASKFYMYPRMFLLLWLQLAGHVNVSKGL